MEIKQSTYRYFFIIGMITWVAAIVLFLLGFNSGYINYLACAKTVPNTTKGSVALNSSIIPQAQGNLNIPAADRLYYYCNWHWSFNPNLSNAFELIFGAGNAVAMVIVLAFAMFSKPKQPNPPMAVVA